MQLIRMLLSAKPQKDFWVECRPHEIISSLRDLVWRLELLVLGICGLVCVLKGN